MNNIQKMLVNLLNDWVDRFKTKTPQTFVIVVAIIFGAQQSVQSVMMNPDFTDTVINIFGMEFKLMAAVSTILVLLLSITGSHTPEGSYNVVAAKPMNIWAEGSSYKAGDRVKVGSDYYVAQKDHNSLKLNKPPVDVMIDGEYWSKM